MPTTTLDQPSFSEIKRLLDEAGLRIGQALRLLDQLRGDAAAHPTLSAKELARVERVGEVAYRHWAFIQEHGTMTLDDSLAIRRELYGDKVQATANLFGRAGQGAILRRTTKYGTKVSHEQEVVLTEDGERIAKLWKQLHP